MTADLPGRKMIRTVAGISMSQQRVHNVTPHCSQVWRWSAQTLAKQPGRPHSTGSSAPHLHRAAVSSRAVRGESGSVGRGLGILRLRFRRSSQVPRYRLVGQGLQAAAGCGCFLPEALVVFLVYADEEAWRLLVRVFRHEPSISYLFREVKKFLLASKKDLRPASGHDKVVPCRP